MERELPEDQVALTLLSPMLIWPFSFFGNDIFNVSWPAQSAQPGGRRSDHQRGEGLARAEEVRSQDAQVGWSWVLTCFEEILILDWMVAGLWLLILYTETLDLAKLAWRIWSMRRWQCSSRRWQKLWWWNWNTTKIFGHQVKKSEGEPFDFISKFNLPILNALWNITAGCQLYHHWHHQHHHLHPHHHQQIATILLTILVGHRFEYNDPKLLSMIEVSHHFHDLLLISPLSKIPTLKIPSEMEEAPHCKLLTLLTLSALLTLFTPLKLLFTAKTLACMPIYC